MHRLYAPLLTLPYRIKLMLLMLASAGTALLITSVAYIGMHYVYDRHAADQRYLQIADVISLNLTAAVLFRDKEAIVESLESLRRIPDVPAIAVLDSEGELIAEYVKPGADGPPVNWGTVAAGPHAVSTVQVSRGYALAPIILNDRVIGTLIMCVQRKSLHDNIRASFPVAVAVFAIGLALAFAVGILIRAMVFRPMVRLTTAMREIGQSGDFSRRLDFEPDPDFNWIAQSFNRMLREVEARNEQLAIALVQVRLARDAEQVSQAKSQFMANMSHELRTPLNAIIGYAEVLREDFMEEGNSQSLEDVNWIYTSARQLLSLINSVLDFSKITAGKMTIEVREFDPVELLKEVQGILEPLATASNNRLTVNLDGLHGTIRSDPTKLTQCLLNLGSNACKFTADGRIDISACRKQASILIEIADTGEGIAADKLPYLFEPFMQGDLSTTRKHGGTGLGLAITRELARLLGGDISASSEPGLGSVFTLEIAADASPLQQVDVTDEDDPFDGPFTPPGHGESTQVVLVASHEPGTIDLLGEIADRTGIGLIVAGDSETGLEALRTSPPCLAVIDADLPDGDGWLMLDRMQANQQARRIPVIVTSVDGKRREALYRGATEHLAKPVDRADMADLLSFYTRRNQGAILLVEDDAATARLIARSITQAGFTVMEAGTVEAALEVLEHQPVDLVVSDLQLPGMTGQDLIDHIARRPQESQPPVIVITGKPLSREEIENLKGKVRELLFKSGLSPRVIAQKVARYVSRPPAGAAQGGES